MPQLAAAQVRQAFVAALAAGLPGVDVDDGKPWPTDASALPVVRVAAGNDAINSEDITWPQLQEHELELVAEARLRAVESIDTAMDDMALRMQTALFATEAAAHLWPLPNCQLELVAVDRLPTTEGQAAVARVQLRVIAHFQTVSNNPHTLV